MVLLNKFILFIGLTILGILILQSMYMSKQWIRSLVLFLLFDIFIDETTVCTHLCQFLDIMMKDVSYFKMNMSLSIEITDKPEQTDTKICKDCCCQQKNIVVENVENVENVKNVVDEIEKEECYK
jgi:gamma-glutamylcysteine synthetase